MRRMAPAQFRLAIAVIERGGYRQEITGSSLFGPRGGVDVATGTLASLGTRGWLTRRESDGHAWWRLTLDGYAAARHISETQVDAACARASFGLPPRVIGRDHAPLVPGFNAATADDDDDECADCGESLADPKLHCGACGDHVDGEGVCQYCGEVAP